MIPPIGFKLDKATVDYLLYDIKAYDAYRARHGYGIGDIEDAIERIETAVRIFGVTE